MAHVALSSSQRGKSASRLAVWMKAVSPGQGIIRVEPCCKDTCSHVVVVGKECADIFLCCSMACSSIARAWTISMVSPSIANTNMQCASPDIGTLVPCDSLSIPSNRHRRPASSFHSSSLFLLKGFPNAPFSDIVVFFSMLLLIVPICQSMIAASCIPKRAWIKHITRSCPVPRASIIKDWMQVEKHELEQHSSQTASHPLAPSQGAERVSVGLWTFPSEERKVHQVLKI